MRVDSFRFLPRSFRAFFEAPEPLPTERDVVWAPFAARLADARIALLSTGGLSGCNLQPGFDIEREKREPAWGDPTWRAIPHGTRQGELDAHHLHVNTADALADHEVVLPLRALDTLVAERTIGAAAEHHFSVMGYQAAGLDAWRTTTASEIVARLRDEAVDGMVLAPV
jgi:D-proline reductase (dithiol) PrdB